MKHCIIALLLAASTIISVVGCAQIGTPPTSPGARDTQAAPATALPPTSAPVEAPASLASSPAAVSVAFPLIVTDETEREITVATPPERIVSLAPSLTEILFAVGAGDQVVGVTDFCNYPPEAKDRDKVGGFSADSISVETIVALRPDLVLALTSAHQTLIETLSGLDVTVVALDPQTVEAVYDSILLVGRLTNHLEGAQATMETMRAQVDKVVETVAQIPEEQRLRVYYQIWDEPLMAAGPRTFPGQLVTLAGGTNIFGELSEDYPQISAEEVVARNPEVVMGPDTHGDKLTPEQIEQRPGWSGIQAVKDKRVYLIDGDMVSRASPRLAIALDDVARNLYPQLFAQK